MGMRRRIREQASKQTNEQRVFSWWSRERTRATETGTHPPTMLFSHFLREVRRFLSKPPFRVHGAIRISFAFIPSLPRHSLHLSRRRSRPRAHRNAPELVDLAPLCAHGCEDAVGDAAALVGWIAAARAMGRRGRERVLPVVPEGRAHASRGRKPAAATTGARVYVLGDVRAAPCRLAAETDRYSPCNQRLGHLQAQQRRCADLDVQHDLLEHDLKLERELEEEELRLGSLVSCVSPCIARAHPLPYCRADDHGLRHCNERGSRRVAAAVGLPPGVGRAAAAHHAPTRRGVRRLCRRSLTLAARLSLDEAHGTRSFGHLAGGAQVRR